MVYLFLKYLMRLALNSYFRVIKVSGQENIPKEGPILFVSNHPSTLMDPIVIGVFVQHEIYFLAAAEFMGKGLLKFIMEKWFNMIPIYRPSTQPSKSVNNKLIFEKCFSHFKSRGSILIFPEGTSVTQKRLLPVKTGAARMVLGAEKDGSPSIAVIPIGLNYSDPHTFQSELFVSIGKPIYTAELGLDVMNDEFEKAQKLTEEIEIQLKENVIHLEDEKLDSIFSKIRILAQRQFQDSPKEKRPLDTRFHLDQQIQDGLHFYNEHHPEVIEMMNHKLDNYLNRARFYGLHDVSVFQASPKISWYDYGRIIVGTPIFAFGFLANALPYYLTIWIFRRLKVSESFHGSIGFSIGIVLFLAWYMGWAIFIGKLSGLWWLGGILVIFSYLCGRFTLHFLSLVYQLREKGNLKSIFRRNRNVFESLRAEREELMTEILQYASKTS